MCSDEYDNGMFAPVASVIANPLGSGDDEILDVVLSSPPSSALDSDLDLRGAGTPSLSTG